ncbi:MAG: RluA family pseudouridine synthase [Paludibacteraceae bacterium]|nr:RluA family pseudouridine synthase [Paludibacteraceae bacterium]MBQ2065080.1 RluA family pseudouridine synthase [Paludibacteraceae bacterium]MBQ5523917.1 RluA family pseudouridine synthase [Paludibacteraceae bacterium]
MEEYAESILEDEVERYEHYRFTADPGQTLIRVDKFLTDRITGASRSRVQQSADAGNVEVNGEPQKSSYKVKPGDVVTVMMSYPPKDTSIIPEDIPLDIVYEDNELLVVNKPAGMVVHPGHGNFQGTLLNALAWHFGERKPFEAGDDRLGLVHRIDKDTSGLLVIAKTPRSKADLSAQFFNKTTSRLYNALVWGVPDAEGVIVGNIGRDPKDRLAMAVFPEGSEQGKHAVTHYRVLESFNYVSLVECRLETGRTHQIRAHFKHIGHPLFADERYGGDKILRGTTFAKYKQFVDNCFKICPRQALHARTLGFTHPVTREQMSFSSPLPQDMEALIEKWREYSKS